MDNFTYPKFLVILSTNAGFLDLTKCATELYTSFNLIPVTKMKNILDYKSVSKKEILMKRGMKPYGVDKISITARYTVANYTFCNRLVLELPNRVVDYS